MCSQCKSSRAISELGAHAEHADASKAKVHTATYEQAVQLCRGLLAKARTGEKQRQALWEKARDTTSGA
jgi:hypothetical protein